jgi:hypothetical protein
VEPGLRQEPSLVDGCVRTQQNGQFDRTGCVKPTISPVAELCSRFEILHSQTDRPGSAALLQLLELVS